MSEHLALTVAFIFGWVYNALVARAQRKGNGDLTAVWVVGGVLATLLLSATVTRSVGKLALYWQGEPVILTNTQHAAFLELKFFIATGTPMFLGSLWRSIQRLPK